MKTTSLLMMLLLSFTFSVQAGELLVGEKIITSMGQAGIIKSILNESEAVAVFTYPDKIIETTIKKKYVARTIGCNSDERICVGDKVIHNGLSEVLVLGIYGNGLILMENEKGHLISANEKVVASTTGCDEKQFCVGNIVKNKLNENVEIAGIESDDYLVVKKHNRFIRVNTLFLRH